MKKKLYTKSPILSLFRCCCAASVSRVSLQLIKQTRRQAAVHAAARIRGILFTENSLKIRKIGITRGGGEQHMGGRGRRGGSPIYDESIMACVKEMRRIQSWQSKRRLISSWRVKTSFYQKRYGSDQWAQRHFNEWPISELNGEVDSIKTGCLFPSNNGMSSLSFSSVQYSSVAAQRSQI